MVGLRDDSVGFRLLIVGDKDGEIVGVAVGSRVGFCVEGLPVGIVLL